MLVRSRLKFWKFILIVFVLVLFLALVLGVIDDDSVVLSDFLYSTILLILSVAFIVSVGYLNHYVRDKFGASAREDFMSFPVSLISSMIILAIIGTFWYESVQYRETARKDLARNLSLYTHKVIVDGWESDAMNYSQLDGLYEQIFSKPGGDGETNSFLTKKQWDNLHIPVKYVPYKGHEKQWHYAAKFTQEMVNVVRTFNLQKLFPINNQKAMASSFSGIYAGWFTSFRMFMAEPMIRNVWEQGKYSHVNPAFTAWVQYYIIDAVEKDPDFWSKNRERWNKNVAKLLESKNT